MLVLEAEPEEQAQDSIQRRPSPVWTMRMSTYAAPIQNTGSNAFMVSRPWTARNTGAAMTASTGQRLRERASARAATR